MPIFNNKFKYCKFNCGLFEHSLAIFVIIGIVSGLLGCKSSRVGSKTVGKTTNASSTFVTEEPKRLTYQDMIKRFDKNKDGVLDEEELADVQKQLGSKPATFSSTNANDQDIKRAWMVPGKQGTATNDSIIDKYDLNHDGVIDAGEAELLKKDLREGTSQIKKPSKQQSSKTPVINPSVSKTPKHQLVR